LTPTDGLLKGLPKTIAEVLQPDDSNEQLAAELKEEQNRKRKKREHSQER
jgi:hypothetical protein